MRMLASARQRSLAGIVAAMAVVNLVYGNSFPLLALVLDSQGVSKSLIGLSTIVQAAAVLAIAPFAPSLMMPSAVSLEPWLVFVFAFAFGGVEGMMAWY